VQEAIRRSRRRYRDLNRELVAATVDAVEMVEGEIGDLWGIEDIEKGPPSV
jgi:hypothetical protein